MHARRSSPRGRQQAAPNALCSAWSHTPAADARGLRQGRAAAAALPRSAFARRAPQTRGAAPQAAAQDAAADAADERRCVARRACLAARVWVETHAARGPWGALQVSPHTMAVSLFGIQAERGAHSRAFTSLRERCRCDGRAMPLLRNPNPTHTPDCQGVQYIDGRRRTLSSESRAAPRDGALRCLGTLACAHVVGQSSGPRGSHWLTRAPQSLTRAFTAELDCGYRRDLDAELALDTSAKGAIGAGGQGVVRLATRRSDDARFAVKSVPKSRPKMGYSQVCILRMVQILGLCIGLVGIWWCDQSAI